MDLACINFDDGAGSDDDALDATPRRKTKWRGGGINNDERRMRYEMERQMLLAWISPKKVDLTCLSTSIIGKDLYLLLLFQGCNSLLRPEALP